MTNSKKLISFLIAAAILVSGYYLFYAKKQKSEKDQISTQEKATKRELIAKNLADKYHATTGWEENLTYTLQAQERLISRKPILFRGYVDDVFNRDGKTFVRFSSSLLSNIDYVLELECSRSIIESILSNLSQKSVKPYPKFLNEYAIVANIQEVTKPIFALKGSALSEDEVEINIDSSSLFTAKGTCLDIAYID